MTALAQEVSDVSLRDACERLGEILGLGEPVAEEVFAAAMQDQTYARNLLATREEPELLSHLLANPPAVREEPSALALTGRAAQALMRWARTGFTVLDEQSYQRRLAACAACPNQIEARRHPKLYRWVTDGERPKVCGLCGCAIAKKARMSSEQCPGEDPKRPGFNRWGQPTN